MEWRSCWFENWGSGGEYGSIQGTWELFRKTYFSGEFFSLLPIVGSYVHTSFLLFLHLLDSSGLLRCVVEKGKRGSWVVTYLSVNWY